MAIKDLTRVSGIGCGTLSCDQLCSCRQCGLCVSPAAAKRLVDDGILSIDGMFVQLHVVCVGGY